MQSNYKKDKIHSYPASPRPRIPASPAVILCFKKASEFVQYGIMNFIKKFLSNAKTGLIVLFYAFKDKRTPIFSKIVILIAAAYIVLPVDLMPDVFFPVGFLDDLAVAPSLFYLVYKKLPAEVLTEAREKSYKTNKIINISIIVLLCVAAVMAAVILLGLFYLLYKLFF